MSKRNAYILYLNKKKNARFILRPVLWLFIVDTSTWKERLKRAIDKYYLLFVVVVKVLIQRNKSEGASGGEQRQRRVVGITEVSVVLFTQHQ